MSSHAKPRRRLTAVTTAAPAKPRRRLAVLAAAVVVAPGLALLASSIPANAAIPANPRWESNAPFGTWNTGKFDLYNNEWNTSAAGPQTIWGDSYKHWGVQSTQPDSTSVKTYPSVQENYSNTTLGSLHGLWSSYAERMPSVSNFDAEAAYDIWLNNYGIEVMVWVDNHGQRPAGNVVATANIYGKRFQVWQSGNSMFTFALQGKQKRGTIHLLRTMNWLVRHGYLSSSDSLTQVNFGWEICSTDGTPMNFTVTDYSLTTRR
jgi:hypothetical protein